MSLIIGIVIILLAITYPLVIRFGVQKSRIILFIIAFFPGAVLALLQEKNLLSAIPSEDTLILISYIAPVVALVIFLISFFISVKLYERKEF